MESVEEFPVSGKTTGRLLLDEVIQKMGLVAVPLFNLQYIDQKGYPAFLKLDKKVLKHKTQKKDDKNAPFECIFQAQYYPEQVNEELTHATIRRLFWLQIREQIVAGEVYAPPEMSVLFAAMSLQGMHGDYDDSQHSNTIESENELPERVLEQHNLIPLQWAERIRNSWKTLEGTPKDQAIQDYLTITQDLEQYGVTYYEITNKKGTKLWLGVHNLGMDIYEWKNKVTPRLGFPWKEIRNISFNDKRFTIKMVGKDSPDFKFVSPRFRLNKRILALCVGNHQFFVARRRAASSGMSIREDRATLEAKIKKTKEQLLAIRVDLEDVKDASKVTSDDKIHEAQREAGMDKFKTMKKAQGGDATKRIQDFESLEDEEC